MERQRGRRFQLVQKISMVKQLPMLKKILMLILTQFFQVEKVKITINLFLLTQARLRVNLVNISQIVFNIAMIKLIISNQLEMKFQKFSDGLKLLTVNGVVTLLTTFSLLKIRRSLTLTCQLSVLELQTMHMWLTIQGLLTILKTTYKAMVLTLEIATN